MKTKKYAALSVLIMTILSLSILTNSSMMIPANDNAKENSKAPEHSQVIGENWDIERIDFIHFAKPDSQQAKAAKTATCYKLMGVKWTAFPVSYTINPSNPQRLTEEFVTSAISTSAETWDSATSKELINNFYTIDYNKNYGTRDFTNTISFGNYPQDGVIGVTSIWYSRLRKQIVEFDILFDTDFQWGDTTINPSLMDLQNIAVHELGHGVGLNDIYTSTCSDVTMYGSSTEGEIKKRTLEQPDIIGLRSMYGA